MKVAFYGQRQIEITETWGSDWCDLSFGKTEGIEERMIINPGNIQAFKFRYRKPEP